MWAFVATNYGWAVAAGLVALTNPTDSIYANDVQQGRVTQSDVMQPVIGAYERCLATEYSNGLYYAEPQDYVKGWGSNAWTNVVIDGVTNWGAQYYTDLMTNTIGARTDRSMMQTADVNFVKALTNFIKLDIVTGNPLLPERWHLVSLFKTNEIGDSNTLWTYAPEIGTNSATYSNTWAPRAYVLPMQERYKALWNLRWTVSEGVHVHMTQMSLMSQRGYYHGEGKATTWTGAVEAAKADWKFVAGTAPAWTHHVKGMHWQNFYSNAWQTEFGVYTNREDCEYQWWDGFFEVMQRGDYPKIVTNSIVTNAAYATVTGPLEPDMTGIYSYQGGMGGFWNESKSSTLCYLSEVPTPYWSLMYDGGQWVMVSGDSVDPSGNYWPHDNVTGIASVVYSPETHTTNCTTYNPPDVSGFYFRYRDTNELPYYENLGSNSFGTWYLFQGSDGTQYLGLDPTNLTQGWIGSWNGDDSDVYEYIHNPELGDDWFLFELAQTEGYEHWGTLEVQPSVEYWVNYVLVYATNTWTNIVTGVETQDFYECWMTKANWTNSIYTSTAIEHQVTFYALPQKPDFSDYNIFATEGCSNFVEGIWSVAASNAWSWTNINTARLHGNLTDYPTSSITPTTPNESLATGWVVKSNCIAVTDWRFLYCTNKWW